MEKMDNNTKNILYPKGSIFRTLKDDKIDKSTIMYKGSIVVAVTNIKENHADFSLIETEITCFLLLMSFSKSSGLMPK